jgi:hypothetical protein
MDELSTHPTWSSSCFVTKNAGSVTIYVPILTCPCSINVTDYFIVYANFNVHNSTDNLLRQNAETETFYAACIFYRELIIPMLYNF